LISWLSSLSNNLIAAHWTKIKFVVVGVWNTIFGYLVFVGLDMLFASLFSKRYVAYMSAAVLSNILAIINAYIFHKYITFRSTVTGGEAVMEFVRFSSTYLVTFCIGMISLPLFVEVGHIDPKVAGFLTIPLTTLISYLGHQKFSFNNKKLS
jgi:putative flippase GtrA